MNNISLSSTIFGCIASQLACSTIAQAATDPALTEMIDKKHTQAGPSLVDIVVTARKREERLQDIPASITAISANDIARSDLSSLEKIASHTPQLVISRGAGPSGSQFILRGVGTT